MELRHADLFARLLAEDAQWRGRVFKVAQYAARLAIFSRDFHRSRAPPSKQLSELARSLSLIRRGGAFLDSAVYIRDAVSQLRALDGKRGSASPIGALLASPRTLSSVLNGFAGVADDLSTSGAIGLIDSKLLPAWFEKLHASLWAAQCLFSLYFAAISWANVKASLHAAREALLHDINSGAVLTLSASIESGRDGIIALGRQHRLATVALAKAMCDVGQSLPGGLQRGHLLPQWAEIGLGLSSALLAVYKVWADAEERVAGEGARGSLVASDEGGDKTVGPQPPRLERGRSGGAATPEEELGGDSAAAAGAVTATGDSAPASGTPRCGVPTPAPTDINTFSQRQVDRALSGIDVAPSPIARRNESASSSARMLGAAPSGAPLSSVSASSSSSAGVGDGGQESDGGGAVPSQNGPRHKAYTSPLGGASPSGRNHGTAGVGVGSTGGSGRERPRTSGGAAMRLAEAPAQADHDVAVGYD